MKWRTLLDNLGKTLFTEPCPGCGVYIYKDGGCQSVVCGKCKMQFCWFCLQDYKNYQHSTPIGLNTCPIRNGICWVILFMCFYVLLIKLCAHFPFFA